jgi:hypothetical protein
LKRYFSDFRLPISAVRFNVFSGSSLALKTIPGDVDGAIPDTRPEMYCGEAVVFPFFMTNSSPFAPMGPLFVDSEAGFPTTFRFYTDCGCRQPNRQKSLLLAIPHIASMQQTTKAQYPSLQFSSSQFMSQSQFPDSLYPESLYQRRSKA